MSEKAPLNFATRLEARFINPAKYASAEDIIHLNKMNVQLQEVAESLQPVFRQLIIEMMALKVAIPEVKSDARPE